MLTSNSEMNWDDFELVFHNICYNFMRIAPQEHPVVVPVPAGTSNAAKEKYVQQMMENVHVCAYMPVSAGVLSLFANGRTSGISVQCGANFTSIVPVWEASEMDELTIVNQTETGTSILKQLAEVLLKQRQNRMVF